ncbi:hypothetical protein NDU88_009265 [Pleurodeles waltl]|uniref:CARD domain-containing protein n=1 Tax=Pleurodeles waltl TaxID=8319 RepID=A0AAV7NYR6_PLEWA|nr:hypothetical protein NDU88_009265 [Pleurodeles waltl]
MCHKSLDNCFLTESCCEVLASVFKTKKSLEGLWLNGSKLGDSGVKKLCEGLKHPDCELQELRLENCFLTDSCCEDLASVLKANTSLEGLWLNGNKLGDYGVKTLCKGLKHPNCELQELRLIDCSLTDSCCEDLSSVLTANTSIVNLYLGDNDLGYPGVKKLCEDLEHTNHILEILCICGNELSDECSGDPCKTLQKKLEPPQQDITTALIASFQKVFEERKLSGLLSHVKMDQKENSETTENMINPSLEELSGKQFKEFKIRLQLYAEKREQSSIQKLRLENADRLDTAKAMIEHYGHRSALEITKHLMGKILKNNRVKKSEHSVQTCEITFKFSESSVAADTFIRIHRLRLIDRMGNIKSVMDILEYKEILQKEEVEEVLAEKISRSQNSRLIRMVEMKGKESMQEFLLALQKKNPPLFRDLMSATETK